MQLGIVGKSLREFLCLYQSCLMWVGEGASRKKVKEEVNEGFWGGKVLIVLRYWEW
jgi:hypothetical protein